MNVQIKMVGIDHNKAALEYREGFTFTRAEAVGGMEALKETPGVKGVVLLSTCNRTELWLSIAGEDFSPYEMLCGLKRTNPDEARDFFVERGGSDAFRHLMEVACGLDSKIFGEDQIITQVGDAIELSRTHQCTDALLEKVFQTAVAAGKKVRTKVKLTEADPSAALRAVSFLQERKGSLEGLKILIIGNGQMGVMAAKALVAQGAEVRMTLRRSPHRNESKDSVAPLGCTMIPYERRMEEVAWAEAVISATRSPHYTLKREEVEAYVRMEPSLWLDLAVPRDIDPSIGALDAVEIVDMDHLDGADKEGRNGQAVEEAGEIIHEYLGELEEWISLRALLPEIKDTIRRSAADVVERIESPLEEELAADIRRATEKALGKLFFGLKDYLQEPVCKQCIEALHQVALKDTLKS